MTEKIFDACQKQNLKQARRIIQYFRAKGFTGMGEPGTAFGITCLNAHYRKKHSDEELKKVLTDGDGDDSIDAVVFGESSVDIFDFKLEENIMASQLERLESSVERNFGSSVVTTFENCKRLEKHIKRFHSQENTRSRLNIYIARGGLGLKNLGSREKVIIKRLESKAGTHVEIESKQDVLQKMLKIDIFPEWKLSKHGVKQLDPQKSFTSHEALILKIPINNLLNLYKANILQKKDLFATNIRVPKPTVKFSNGLAETIDNKPEVFHLLHNGLTITATKIIEDRRNYLISKPQVVNGAQTIGNLFKRYEKKLNIVKLSKAEIICKIIKADEDFANDICEASNTQRAIKTEDLRSNDSFQKELELYIASESGGQYAYIRKSGSKSDKGSVKLPYTKFFQWVYASFLEQPAKAKNAKTILFDDSSRGEYKNIQTEIMKNISNVISLCNIGMFVGNQIKNEKNRKKKGFLKSSDLHIIAGLFSLNSLAIKDFNRMYKFLKKYSQIEIKKDSTLNDNKIFTKSDKAWVFLKSKI